MLPFGTSENMNNIGKYKITHTVPYCYVHGHDGNDRNISNTA